MSLLQRLLEWMRGGTAPDEQEALHRQNRDAVHLARNSSQISIAVSQLSIKQSNRILNIAKSAIAEIEAAREGSRCDD